MVEMNFSDNSSAMSGIINWIFRLKLLAIQPMKQIFAGNLDLSAITEKVDSVVGLAEISLDSKPSVNDATSRDDIARQLGYVATLHR